MLSNDQLLAVEEAIRKETKSLDRLGKEKPLYKPIADGQKSLLQSALVKLREGVSHETQGGAKK